MRASLLLLPYLIACGPDERVFVGTVQGTDAQVGLVVTDVNVVAYVCGGPDTRTTLTRWFAGSTMRSLEVSPLDSGVGTVTADDWSLSWNGDTGSLVDPDGVIANWVLDDQTGRAALYEGDDSGCRDGAIVWDVDGEPTLQGTWGCYGGPAPMLEVMPVGTLQLGACRT